MRSQIYSWPGEFLEFHCRAAPSRQQKCNKAILWEYKYARIMYREMPHYVTAARIMWRRTKPQAAVCEKISVSRQEISASNPSSGRLCANSLSTRAAPGWWMGLRKHSPPAAADLIDARPALFYARFIREVLGEQIDSWYLNWLA